MLLIAVAPLWVASCSKPSITVPETESSVTGNTRSVAEKIASVSDADVSEGEIEVWISSLQ